MSVTEFDYPSWQGSIGGGALGSVFQSITLRDVAATVVTNIVGISLWYFGSGKVRTFGKVLTLVPDVVWLYLWSQQPFFDSGPDSFDENIWSGPGVVYYVH